MRDSLSILDKIVSFSNGKLTYANTLEHLNILDEDYYFKLIDYLQQQQLPDAMLLFDEINQKGFEGDTFIEGFSEFLRNILVSKDAKAVVLLEVAEDFKKKYLSAAKQINIGWLISALHVLNEAELNYKQARNKKLHIEMTIIKLCFLQQAIEIVNNEDGLSKKKLTANAKAVSFRSLPIIPIKEIVIIPVKDAQEEIVGQEGLLTRKDASATAYEKVELLENGEATLIIQDPLTELKLKKQKVGEVEKEKQIKPNSSFGLKKIREQFSNQNPDKNGEPLPLNEENLQNAWKVFIETLELKKNHSAVSNFNMAKLSISDEKSFDIITENGMQQKFIEAERSQLVHHFQQWFNNRQLVYRLVLKVNENVETITEKPLSSKEQYNKLVEQYPYIKELKERLNLDLDY